MSSADSFRVQLQDELIASIQENGTMDKIIVPPSIIESISRGAFDGHLTLELNFLTSIVCGVQQFTAPEGICLLPSYIAQRLCVEEGDIVSVRRVFLPKCDHLQILPLTQSFSELDDPRSVLEAQLHRYSVIEQGQTIAIEYLDNTYELLIESVGPEPRCSLIDVDINLDLSAAPVKEPEIEKETTLPETTLPETIVPQEPRSFVPFAGSGNVLASSSNDQIPWYKRK